jgi:hypothetical protein
MRSWSSASSNRDAQAVLRGALMMLEGMKIEYGRGIAFVYIQEFEKLGWVVYGAILQFVGLRGSLLSV